MELYSVAAAEPEHLMTTLNGGGQQLRAVGECEGVEMSLHRDEFGIRQATPDRVGPAGLVQCDPSDPEFG